MKKILYAAAFVMLNTIAFSQGGAKWELGGNAISTGDKLGTTNNKKLSLITNNTERFYISSTGHVYIVDFAGSATGLITHDASGKLVRINFTGSTNDVLLGNGTFASLSTVTGWLTTGGVTHTLNKVAINTTATTHALEVNGTSKFTGSITSTGENFFSGKTHMYRIAPMPGDSLIRFGDSTIIFDHTNNRMYSQVTCGPLSCPSGLGIASASATATGAEGVAMGAQTNVTAARGFAFGYYVKSTASDAFAIGKGIVGTHLVNNTANSLMVGFNSTIPTLFVGEGSGAGTLGKVGIGTSTPQDLFEIKPNANFKLSIGSAYFSDLAWGTSYMGFNAVHTSAGTWSTASDGSNNGGSVFFSNVQGSMFFATIPRTGTTAQTGISNTTVVNNTRLYIDGVTGAVGIGTTCIPANTKLAVNGTVYAKDVWVKQPDAGGCWPDYVFDSSYDLKSLEEVNAYINNNQHLPSIPSAKEVEENGIQVGEMQRIQMEKIEELYLYMINMNKEIQDLKKENAELKKQLNK